MRACACDCPYAVLWLCEHRTLCCAARCWSPVFLEAELLDEEADTEGEMFVTIRGPVTYKGAAPAHTRSHAHAPTYACTRHTCLHTHTCANAPASAQ